MLTRYRVQLMGDRTRETVRLELMLEDASIKLSAVASSLTTVSARAMLAAMIDGERDARVLAEMAKGRMRRKIPDLAQALTGTSTSTTPSWPARSCAGWTWSSRRWPSSTRSSSAACAAVGASDRAAADHSRRRGEGRPGDRRRDRRGHVPVPVRGAPGGVGRPGAGDVRVRRQAHPGRHAGTATSG